MFHTFLYVTFPPPQHAGLLHPKINPPRISKRSIRRLEDLRGRIVILPLLWRQLRIKQADRPPGSVIPRTIIMILCLNRQIRCIPRSPRPINETRGQNRSIQIRIGKNSSHLHIPGSAEGAFSFDSRGDSGIGGAYTRVDDVDAIFVDEGCVGSFPGCDSAAAVAEADGG